MVIGGHPTHPISYILLIFCVLVLVLSALSALSAFWKLLRFKLLILKIRPTGFRMTSFRRLHFPKAEFGSRKSNSFPWSCAMELFMQGSSTKKMLCDHNRHRAALKGTNLRGRTPICGFLRVPAVFCETQRFSAKICISQMLCFLLFPNICRRSGRIFSADFWRIL